MSRACGDTGSPWFGIRAAKKWRPNGRTAPRQELIRRALDPTPAAIEDVTVNHRGLHVAVAEQLLHRTDIVPRGQEMGRKAMALMPHAA